MGRGMIKMNEIDEKIRRYWVGKNPRVKAAVMEWIEKGGEVSQMKIAKKYGVTVGTFPHHIRNLRKMGVSIPEKRVFCSWCGIDLSRKFPKYDIRELPKSCESRHVGYLCEKCWRKIRGESR